MMLVVLQFTKWYLSKHLSKHRIDHENSTMNDQVCKNQHFSEYLSVRDMCLPKV